MRVLIDVGITYGLSLLAGFVIGFTSALAQRPTPTIMIAVGNVLSCVIGFTIAGCYTKQNRWSHLLLVAAGLWLLGLTNLALGVSFIQWVLSIVVIFATMGIGGGIASLFKKQSHQPSLQPDVTDV